MKFEMINKKIINETKKKTQHFTYFNLASNEKSKTSIFSFYVKIKYKKNIKRNEIYH